MKPFRIKSDASLKATGGVLSQKQMDGHWHPCAFLLQSLSPIEQQYKIYDRELLAIIRCFKAWRLLPFVCYHLSILFLSPIRLPFSVTISLTGCNPIIVLVLRL